MCMFHFQTAYVMKYRSVFIRDTSNCIFKIDKFVYQMSELVRVNSLSGQQGIISVISVYLFLISKKT